MIGLIKLGRGEKEKGRRVVLISDLRREVNNGAVHCENDVGGGTGVFSVHMCMCKVSEFSFVPRA